MPLAKAIFCLVLLAAPAWAQSPPAGIPVDAHGNQTIDPTKNVLDLVLAAVKRLDDVSTAYMKRQDDLREAESRLQHAMREADTKRLSDLREVDTRRSGELREAETRRVNELAQQKQAFDLELARINKSSLDSSALLLASAVKELKTDFSDRTAKLEQFANEQRGRSSAGSETWALIGVLVAIVVMLMVGIGLVFNLTRHSVRTKSVGEGTQS